VRRRTGGTTNLATGSRKRSGSLSNSPCGCHRHNFVGEVRLSFFQQGKGTCEGLGSALVECRTSKGREYKKHLRSQVLPVGVVSVLGNP
jgi:hypothetical protein